jgi:hypothetical protein
MGAIKRGQVPSLSKNIPKPAPQASGTIRFSFKHIDLVTNPKFALDRCRGGYLLKLLERLRDLCLLKDIEFRTSRSSSINSHQIDWSTTSEPDGFTTLNQQLREVPAWQFEITRNEHGRVHGFLLEDTFFVVWFDPDHELYN